MEKHEPRLDAPEEDGKTPGLSADEKEEVHENQPPRAAVLHEPSAYRATMNWNVP